MSDSLTITMSAITALPKSTHDTDVVRQLLNAVSTEGQNLEQCVPGSHEALLGQARALVTALEDPMESIFEFTFGEVIKFYLFKKRRL